MFLTTNQIKKTSLVYYCRLKSVVVKLNDVKTTMNFKRLFCKPETDR